MVAGDRVGQDSRHQTIALPAIIELGAWRQSMIDAIAKFEDALVQGDTQNPCSPFARCSARSQRNGPNAGANWSQPSEN